jgi:hypothetical protein
MMKNGEEEMQYDATAIGLTMLACCLVAFVLVLPRGGQVNPLVRSEGAQIGFLMVMILPFFVGAGWTLFGFPADITVGDVL